MMVQFESETWYIESIGLSLVWAGMQVSEPEDLTEEEKVVWKDMDGSAKYRANH